jgi:hypothetical protein
MAAFRRSAPDAAQGWEEYSYPDYPFSVAFPANPQVETTTYQVADNRVVPARCRKNFRKPCRDRNEIANRARRPVARRLKGCKFCRIADHEPDREHRRPDHARRCVPRLLVGGGDKLRGTKSISRSGFAGGNDAAFFSEKQLLGVDVVPRCGHRLMEVKRHPDLPGLGLGGALAIERLAPRSATGFYVREDQFPIPIQIPMTVLPASKRARPTCQSPTL